MSTVIVRPSDRLGDIAEELLAEFVVVVSRLFDTNDRDYAQTALFPYVVAALKRVQQHEWTEANRARDEHIESSATRFATARDRQIQTEQRNVDTLRRQLHAHGIEPERCVTSGERDVQIDQRVKAMMDARTCL